MLAQGLLRIIQPRSHPLLQGDGFHLGLRTFPQTPDRSFHFLLCSAGAAGLIVRERRHKGLSRSFCLQWHKLMALQLLGEREHFESSCAQCAHHAQGDLR